MAHWLVRTFLALLDCVSRANAVAQAAVVRPFVRRPSFRKTRCLRIRQANQCQILWKGSYPPYLQTTFCVFKILDFWSLTNFNSVNMGPYGSENFQTLLLLQLQFFFNQTFCTYSLCRFSPNLLIGFWNFKIVKRYSNNSLDSFSTKHFLNVWQSTPNFWFWNFKFKLKKKRLKFCAQWENAKFPISWKWTAVEQNRVKFRTRG